MMDAKSSFCRQTFVALLAIPIIALLVSCTYCRGVLCPSPPYIGGALHELTDSGQNTVFEGPGTIIVYHGFGCAESNKSGTEDVLRVEQSLDLPAYATNATVFLNGWRVRYLHKDHKVAGLGTAIGNIRLERNTLKWQAIGVLSDRNFDDAYRWCYYYTVVAWNPSNLNLTVDHKDGSCDVSVDPSQVNFFYAGNDGTTTALSSFPSFLQNPNFSPSKTVAILPRGFGFNWLGCNEDHNLLQIGYNLDHSEIFIENGKKYKKKLENVTPSLPNAASQVDSGYVSWETYGIFKDSDRRRDYSFGEMVSGLGGNDVGVVQPPFSILPTEEDSIFPHCVSSGAGVKTQEFIIENVPYEYAIPMLTGWELEYDCYDQHVAEAGIWIDDIHYRDPNDPPGRLRYTLSSILKDKDNDPNFQYHHKITILGLRPVTRGGTPSQRVPDLLPFSPLGTDPSAFCRIEQSGKLLRVMIKNQGNADASTSKTTVTFVNKPFTLDTPPIPAGGSVDLLFKVPSGCFNPDCSFKINVDSSNQVNESNEQNNSANGVCKG